MVGKAVDGIEASQVAERREMDMRRTHATASLLVVMVSVIALALPAIVAAREVVDPATLTPPPPPEFNPTCERIGNQIICEVVFTDPPVVDEPSGVVCGGTELLFSETRSVVGKRFYSAEGLLLRRHFHDDVSGTWTNPVSGATALFSGGSMTLHDLAVPGDVGSGTSRISGSVRIYLPDGGTIIHNDAGHLVIDEGTGTVLSQSGQHPFEDFFGNGDTTALDEFCSALA